MPLALLISRYMVRSLLQQVALQYSYRLQIITKTKSAG